MLRFRLLAVALVGRLWLDILLDIDTEEVGAELLPAFSYSVTRVPPLRRFTPCVDGCDESGLDMVLVELRSALPVGEAEREAVLETAAKAACTPACLIFLSSAFVGRMILPSITLGRAGQF
jgi:hypothetical protein